MTILKKLFKNKVNIGLILAIIVIGSIAAAKTFGPNSEAEDGIEVKLGTVVQEVSVTGKTQPVKHIDLAFEQGGRVAAVAVKPGDQITTGQVLARLDTAELAGQLRQAQARVTSERARLAEVKRGARPEELNISEAQVTSAKNSVENARRELSEAISDAYVKSDDAIKTRADRFFDTTTGYPLFGIFVINNNTTISFTPADPQYTERVQLGRVKARTALDKLKVLATDQRDPIQVATEAQVSMREIAHFFTDLTAAVATFKTEDYQYQATLGGYRADVSAGRSTVSGALASLIAAEKAYTSAQNQLAVAQKELTLKQSGSTSEAITLQQAAVSQAQGQVDVIAAQMKKLTLTAPFAGTVAKVDVSTGELAASAKSAITLVSSGAWEVETLVPEVDIGKIALGDPVDVTIDALPDKTYVGTVSQVDKAETVIDGVVNYGIKILLEGTHDELKSGLTVNVAIKTDIKEHVLVVPQFAIIEKDEGSFVMKIEKDEQKEVPVKIGVRGNDGNVEIISGLKEGDIVANVGLKTDNN